MVSFWKERETQKAITEIKWYESWNAEVYRNVYKKQCQNFKQILRKAGTHHKHKKENSRKLRQGIRKK